MTSRGIDMIQKYRAWNKKEKKMYYQKDYNITFFADGSWEMWLPEHEPSVICNSENSILLQSTGLKDKNSREIWEGDIIKTPNWYWKEGLFVVKYDDIIPTGTIWGAFYPFNIIGKSCEGEEILCPYSIEVIGNRFENPELLEEASK